MKKIFICIGSFVIGAVSASVVTALICKKRYTKNLNEEIKEIREMYSSGTSNNVKKIFEKKEGKKSSNLKDIKTEEDKIEMDKTRKYKDYSKKYSSSTEKGGSDESINLYRILDSQEVAESDYEIKTCYYYNDKVLSDDDGNIIPNISTLIGDINIDNIHKEENSDVVYIYNVLHNTVYEIILEDRDYVDEWGENEGLKIYPKEDEQY